MDQHPGASITLSFLLVVVFAIVLYPPENSTPASGSPEPVVAEPGEALAPLPPLTPSEPLVAATETFASITSLRMDRGRELATFDGSEPKSIALPSRESSSHVERSARGPGRMMSAGGPVSNPPRARPRPAVPREAFTIAHDGETLEDVAVRVYGSADEVDALWRLNRDLIRRGPAPLPPGTLLRTP